MVDVADVGPLAAAFGHSEELVVGGYPQVVQFIAHHDGLVGGDGLWRRADVFCAERWFGNAIDLTGSGCDDAVAAVL